MLQALESIADTLSQKPEVGVFGSMVGVAFSPISIIALISAILGLIITIITLIIKVMDIWEKIKRKKERMESEDGEFVIIDDVKYHREKVGEEEEE